MELQALQHGVRSMLACAILLAPAACGSAEAPPDAVPGIRAEMSYAASSPVAEGAGTMTLPGADGATTRFGEEMRLADLPEWLVVPDGVAPTGEGFLVTTAQGRRTGSIRLAMEGDPEAAVTAWTEALGRAGFHVRQQSGIDPAAGIVVGTGEDGRRVHVSITSAGEGTECSVQYAGD